MMLLRGQSLVGYRSYADDVVDAFVERSAECGIDVFRVFDALNYPPNLETAAEAVKRAGKHLQLAVCYSVTEEGRLGGPIYNLEYFVEKARIFQDMGADSICLKDMGGLLAPYDAYELVTALKAVLDVPLQLHTHYTSGMASMSVLKAIEAGLDIVDTCLAPLALRTSQPAVEPLLMSLQGGDRDPGLPMARLLEIGDVLESALPRYRVHLERPRSAVIDARVLSHQIPGGMASNLVSQLRDADALDRLDEVLREIPRTRADMGFPPLVTPMSQMVGSQSVSNVLFGRYEMISEAVKDYVRGEYGKPPAPVDGGLRSRIQDDADAATTVPERPAALIAPEMDAAREAVAEITADIDDVLIYALYPQTGMRFLRIKHGLEPVPDEMKQGDSEGRDGAATGAPEAPSPAGDAPPLSPRAQRFNVYVGGQFFQVDVDPAGASSAPPRSGLPSGPPPSISRPTVGPDRTPAQEVAAGETPVAAPMPGILVSLRVEVGQQVSAGDPVVVLEAMKMQNVLPAPVAGTVKSLPVPPGTQVVKDQVLAIIAP
jgi:pyruvate carboxylase subunit B